jgi:hypothetical protein
MRHWELIAEFEREGFDIVVDKTWEDIDPWSQLSECFDSKRQLYADIDSGKYEWFMLRVRALIKGREMGCSYLGGCLYERAEDVMTDGTVEDQLIEVLKEARQEALILQGLLKSLIDKRVQEAV